MRRYPTLDEISGVLKGMSRGKSPVLDGMIVEILVHHWNIIKNDFLAAVLHFFRNH